MTVAFDLQNGKIESLVPNLPNAFLKSFQSKGHRYAVNLQETRGQRSHKVGAAKLLKLSKARKVAKMQSCCLQAQSTCALNS